MYIWKKLITKVNSIAIRIIEVSKRYNIGIKREETFASFLSRILKNKNLKSVSSFNALENASFSIPKGQVVGIIGKNGAGKSTLLKILSQITKPTSGRIEIDGRIA